MSLTNSHWRKSSRITNIVINDSLHLQLTGVINEFTLERSLIVVNTMINHSVHFQLLDIINKFTLEIILEKNLNLEGLRRNLLQHLGKF